MADADSHKDGHDPARRNGAAVTVLHLHDGVEMPGPHEEIAGPLSEVSQHVHDIAGGDDDGMVSMYSVYPNEEGSLEFLALELVPLRQAIQRIHQIDRGEDARTILHVVERPDDLDDGDGPGGHALAHLRRAVHELFSRAAETGHGLRVLGLRSHLGGRGTTDNGS